MTLLIFLARSAGTGIVATYLCHGMPTIACVPDRVLILLDATALRASSVDVVRHSSQFANKFLGFVYHTLNLAIEEAKVLQIESLCVPCHLPNGPEQRVQETEDLVDISNQCLFEQCGDCPVILHALVREHLVPNGLVDNFELCVMWGKSISQPFEIGTLRFPCVVNVLNEPRRVVAVNPRRYSFPITQRGFREP